jgi:2-polyprenyl-3-methyl-5-hydroxy-6-metoxy-1,4-benzoquinol methylase
MSQDLDQARMDAFVERVLGIINGAGLAYLFSVGHRTGLFDAMAGTAPATAAEIAETAGLRERYVREWLNGCVVGGVLDYDSDHGTYWLPPEHAAVLTRAAGVDNLASQGQYLAMFGLVEDDIVACFRDGGGVPYSKFPAFQALMAEDSAASYDVALVDGVLPLVPGLVSRLESGIDVADVGCGQGHAINLMAQAFPNSLFIGLDFSEQAIASGRAEAAALGLTNAAFEVRDLAAFTGAFDLVTGFDVVHDQAQPRQVLDAIRASLRPDGVFLCADIAASSKVEQNLEHPIGPWLYTISLFHCMTVSLAYDGEGLGTMWGEDTAVEYFAGAGFRVEEPQHVDGDPVNVYYVCHPA